jgi:hypothetical protein
VESGEFELAREKNISAKLAMEAKLFPDLVGKPKDVARNIGDALTDSADDADWAYILSESSAGSSAEDAGDDRRDKPLRSSVLPGEYELARKKNISAKLAMEAKLFPDLVGKPKDVADNRAYIPSESPAGR